MATRSQISPSSGGAKCNLDKTLRSYGATIRKQPGFYKHFIPTGLLCPRNFPKNKKLDVCYAKRQSRHGY
jgi:hypothetical protein